MQVDVSALRRAATGESVAFAFTDEEPDLSDLPGLRVGAVTGQVSQLGDRLLAAGTVAGSVQLECSRCTCPFRHELAADFSDEYAEQPTEEQSSYRGDRLDLRPAIRAALLLQLPSQPIHDPACKGLCEVCGQDLNKEPHQHEDDSSSDHPFAVLKKLKK